MQAKQRSRDKEREIETILTLELEPADWATEDCRLLLGKSEFADCWAEELSTLGLTPVFPGSWYVPVDQFSDGPVLQRLIWVALGGDSDEPPSASMINALDPEENVVAMAGGVLFRDQGKVLLEPSCCCDLGNLDGWLDTVEEADSKYPFSVGHGDVQGQRNGSLLVIRLNPGDDRNDRVLLEAPVAVVRDALLSAVETRRGLYSEVQQGLRALGALPALCNPLALRLCSNLTAWG